MPTYMDDSSRGFGLAEGGYYFAISDIMDVMTEISLPKVRGDFPD